MRIQDLGEWLLGVVASAATLRAEALKTWVLSMTGSIVEVKLGGELKYDLRGNSYAT